MTWERANKVMLDLEGRVKTVYSIRSKGFYHCNSCYEEKVLA